MTVPDPDKDILDKLDRREWRRKILPGIAAFAGGCAAGLVAYDIMRSVFRWPVPAPLYGALVVFIGVATWLFVKMSEGH
jgi:fatty acid desaturase